MDKTTPTENQLEVTAEEKQFDQEVLSETKEEEVRSSLIEKYGLNEEDNAELLDQLVADNLESRKKLSKAVQQKINYRDKHPLLNKQPQTPETPGTPEPKKEISFDPEEIRRQATEVVRAQFDEEYLGDKNYPDEINTEIKEWAKFKGISAKRAEKAPHIQASIQEAVKAGKIDEAAISGTPKSVPAKGGIPDFGDLSKPENLKKYQEWKKNRTE